MIIYNNTNNYSYYINRDPNESTSNIFSDFYYINSIHTPCRVVSVAISNTGRYMSACNDVGDIVQVR
jgi:hypothetical protein